MSRSQRKRANRRNKCVVCRSVLIDGDDAEGLQIGDNALSCSGSHQTCINCVRSLLRPTYKTNSNETGMAFVCPKCNIPAMIGIMHNLVLVQSSWKKAMDMFEDEDHLGKYLQDIRSFPKPFYNAYFVQLRTIFTAWRDMVSNMTINKKDSAEETKQCVVCMSEERSHAIIPCGHKCLCIHCASNHSFNECPLCRATVTLVCKIYE